MCREPEQGTGQVIVGKSEVRVVGDIEELRAEIEPHLFGQWKLPLNGEVDVGGSEATQHTAAENDLLAGRCSGEGGLFEDLATRILRPCDLLTEALTTQRVEVVLPGNRVRTADPRARETASRVTHADGLCWYAAVLVRRVTPL